MEIRANGRRPSFPSFATFSAPTSLGAVDSVPALDRA